MTFWAFLGSLTILGIMFGALYLSKMAANKELAEQEKRKKIRSLRNDLVDMDELISTLLVYDRNPDLLQALTERMRRTLDQGFHLLPDNEDLKADLADLKRTNERIEELRAEPEAPENPASDRQIYLIKKNFAATRKLLKTLQQQGEITELEAGDHRARLIRNSLLLEVEAYRVQASEAQARGEISSAANFLKHAKDLLVNSDIKFAAKTEHIKQVSREISGLYVTLPGDEDKQNRAEDSADS